MNKLYNKIESDFNKIIEYSLKNKTQRKLDISKIKNRLELCQFKINNKIQEIEYFIDNIKSKEYRNYYDYLYLSAYKYIYISKEVLEKCHKTIVNICEKTDFITITNIISTKKKSIFPINYIYFIVENLNYDVDYSNLLKKSHMSELDFNYLIYYLLFICLYRIDINSNDLIKNYVSVSNNISVVLTLFRSSENN